MKFRESDAVPEKTSSRDLISTDILYLQPVTLICYGLVRLNTQQFRLTRVVGDFVEKSLKTNQKAFQ